MALLSVENLSIGFKSRKEFYNVVQDLSFSLDQGEVLSIVGESGCGKTVTAYSIAGILESPPGKISGGCIIFENQDLLLLGKKELRKIQGRKISMIFQEPMTSLNPVYSIGQQLSDVIRQHNNLQPRQIKERAVELLDLVQISSPRDCFDNYPHQLSGGMRQRVMIAMALSSPDLRLLIADEPTTALDVTIQAQIIELLHTLREKTGLAMIIITHDLGLVAHIADSVAVMYAGRKVEYAPLSHLLRRQYHPYTRGLLECLPSHAHKKKTRTLTSIEGTVPHPRDISVGCPFSPRCARSQSICTQTFPGESGEQHQFWCHNPVKNLSKVKNG